MVYFIKNSEGHIKIGSSNNLDRRLMELQIGNSAALRLLYVIETPDEQSLMFEQHIQGLCKRYSIQGEWFDPKCLDHLLHHPWFKENMRAIESQEQPSRPIRALRNS